VEPRAAASDRRIDVRLELAGQVGAQDDSLVPGTVVAAGVARRQLVLGADDVPVGQRIVVALVQVVTPHSLTTDAVDLAWLALALSRLVRHVAAIAERKDLQVAVGFVDRVAERGESVAGTRRTLDEVLGVEDAIARAADDDQQGERSPHPSTIGGRGPRGRFAG